MSAEIRNAIIKSVTLDDADRGFLNAWVNLDYGNSGQGFGGYALYMPEGFSNHSGPNFAGHFIWRVMTVAGVTRWEHAPGKAVRVRIENGLAKAIGHVLKDDWFEPGIDFKVMEAEFEAMRAAVRASREPTP